MSKNQEILHLYPITKMHELSGLLLLNKAKGITSFGLVRALRKITGVQKIGHAGTLDPFATGVMILLLGKKWTQRSDQFLSQDKEYLATLSLGKATDTYDLEGKIVSVSSYVPTLLEVEALLKEFQGEKLQVPPMFSAKKLNGKKLYELARKGIEVERKPSTIWLKIELVSYAYPFLSLKIQCSKGTYVRSIAHEMGLKLGSFAHLSDLTRTRSGSFHLKDCIELASCNDLSHLSSQLRKDVS